ncbi:MAG: hypothetical protein B7Z20_03545 [Sphingobium sp. 32-64-5]|jgi:hypothetical protein|uniref:hypothetical protein n=1 Tax=Sphingobium aromaticiconvertens TaxID=365341 RepID=UPI000BD01FC6|nr:MAG: hypothetical protein B7Z20_03545 [Sphingobium sp. 32-64-5]
MRLPRSRSFYITLAIAALGVILLANAHLVYVASTSQPQCVVHVKSDGSAHAAGVFGAAKSSC